MKKPIKVAFGWSRAEESFISNAIRYLTRPKWSPFSPWADWSHMFLVFYFDDGSAEIHEALMSEGWSKKPSNKLGEWILKDPQKHQAFVSYLDGIPEVVVGIIYHNSSAWIGRKSYAIKQIAAFAIAESLLGRWLGLSLRSGPGEVICSEGACKLVGGFVPKYDVREPGEPWDAIHPQRAFDVHMKRHYGDDNAN